MFRETSAERGHGRGELEGECREKGPCGGGKQRNKPHGVGLESAGTKGGDVTAVGLAKIHPEN